MVDTNCAWDEAQAIAAARSMRDLDLMMIEEPVLS
jgi:L-alanine-DL-glutamate epimerase-like enolase superfamily enzyme